MYRKKYFEEEEEKEEKEKISMPKASHPIPSSAPFISSRQNYLWHTVRKPRWKVRSLVSHGLLSVLILVSILQQIHIQDEYFPRPDLPDTKNQTTRRNKSLPWRVFQLSVQ